jgi:hypothetical protein
MISDVDLRDWIHLQPTPLYSVPKRNYVKWCENYFFFDHLDGMYSYCLDMTGNIFHIPAAAQVTPLRKPPKEKDTQ